MADEKNAKPADECWLSINKKMSDILRLVVSKEESRPILNCIHICRRYVEATNGHILVRFALMEDEAEAIGDRHMLIHGDSLRFVTAKALLGIELFMGRVRVDIDQNVLTRARGRMPGAGAYPMYLPEADIYLLEEAEESADPEKRRRFDIYPNTEKIFPSETDPEKEPDWRELGLGGPPLTALAKIAGKSGGLHFKIPEHREDSNHVVSAVHFVHTAPGRKMTGVVMPIRLLEDQDTEGGE